MRKVLVTGHKGFVGQAVRDYLAVRGEDEVITCPDLDLREPAQVRRALNRNLPDAVIHLAYPGGDGIGDAKAHPATLAADLLRMDLTVIQACAAAQIPKLVCLGSVCAYPEHTTLPTDESQLWAGYPEPVNASYGVVKRTQLTLLQAYRQELGLNGIHLVLANLYGPGDRSGHVIPALIRRMRVAQRDGTPLVVWGSPDVTRSFLYIDDAAEGIVRALDGYDRPEPLNLVPRVEYSMRELVMALSRRLAFTGPVVWDAAQPTGHRRRWFSVKRLEVALGWVPATSMSTGLDTTVAWHLSQESV